MNPRKCKLSLSIDPLLTRRLDFQASRDGKGHDRSSIVEALIVLHLHLPGEVSDFFTDAPGTEPLGDKSSRRRSAEAVTRDKTTFYFSAPAAKRLGHYAVWAERDRGSIVEDLVREHVAPWEIYDPRESHLTTRRKDRLARSGEISPAAVAGAGE